MTRPRDDRPARNGDSPWSRRAVIRMLGLGGALGLAGAWTSAPGPSGWRPERASKDDGLVGEGSRPVTGSDARPLEDVSSSTEPVSAMRTREIPSTGEAIPVVGLGTWQTFDVDPDSAEGHDVREVLRLFVEHGGQVIDSSPMYGRSEAVVGQLATELDVADELWYATKVWTEGEEQGVAQMERSFELLRVGTMDLVQVHNLVDWRTHLRTLRRWKDMGRVRYIGITHYRTSAYDQLASILEREPLDFVQLNYNMAVRNAEDRMLPLAADRGAAVMVNRPYQGGALFGRVRGREVPAWARERGMESWGRFFLKYLLSHPAVTCVIPATSDPEHLVDNVGAGTGSLPDEATRRRMVRYLEEQL